MEKVYAVVAGEVSRKGRTFPNEVTFLNWLSTMSQYKRHGLTTDEFFGGFQALVLAQRILVKKKRGNVRVKVVDNA